MATFQGVWLQYHHLLLWTIFMMPAVVSPEMVYRVDPLALLSGTLRTYQKAGCDSDMISLSCPRGTSISIEVAQYGNTVGDETIPANICPPSTSTTSDATSLDVIHVMGGGDDAGSTVMDVKPKENCLPNALQYSLLQHVVETCQKKSHCKFLATPSRHGPGDPCPDKQKFVEVAYKCRPYEFRSKVACENDVIQLVCNPYSRIAIYSASFGRTEYESIQCSQPQGVMEETCLVSAATETVMSKCHGRRRCSVMANITTFGNPCRPDSRVYLKVVYTCIPRKVLKNRFDYSNEPDEPQHVDPDLNQDDLYDEDQFYRESEAIPPAPKLHRELSKSMSGLDDYPTIEPALSSVNPPQRTREGNHHLEAHFPPRIPQSTIVPKPSANLPHPHSDRRRHHDDDDKSLVKSTALNRNRSSQTPLSPHSVSEGIFIPAATSKYPFNEHVNSTEPDCEEKPIGFVAEWMNAYIFLEKNQEKFYLYLIISVTAGVLLCLVLVIGRLLLQRRRLKKEPHTIQASTTGETTLPNGFADDISEIDNDIDLTTPLPLPSVSRSDQSYGTYAPSPSPYGNLGPTNVSHTSTTMLVPSSSMLGGQPPQQQHPPPNLLSGTTNALMYHHHQPPNMQTGMLSHNYPHPMYIGGGSIVGHHGTLRRPREYEHTPPRILSKIDADQQFYYG